MAAADGRIDPRGDGRPFTDIAQRSPTGIRIEPTTGKDGGGRSVTSSQRWEACKKVLAILAIAVGVLLAVAAIASGFGAAWGIPMAFIGLPLLASAIGIQAVASSIYLVVGTALIALGIWGLCADAKRLQRVSEDHVTEDFRSVNSMPVIELETQKNGDLSLIGQACSEPVVPAEELQQQRSKEMAEKRESLRELSAQCDRLQGQREEALKNARIKAGLQDAESGKMKWPPTFHINQISQLEELTSEVACGDVSAPRSLENAVRKALPTQPEEASKLIFQLVVVANDPVFQPLEKEIYLVREKMKSTEGNISYLDVMLRVSEIPID